jgi:hypothetical protein
VITAGVYDTRWKAEASVFNGREPDEDRTGFDAGALDSVSGRLWFLPASNWAFQISAGALSDAEPSDTGGAGVDVTRTTASATYHRAFDERGIWATTIAWGRNGEPGHATHAVLVETSLAVADRDTWYGRFETVGKSRHDLAVAEVEESADTFTVAKLQGGYTRYFGTWKGFTPGAGGVLSAGIVPTTLQATYGGRVNLGLGVYLTLRPGRQ